MSYRDQARQVLEIEVKGIKNIIDQLDESFDELVGRCLEVLTNKGKLVLSGVGKSGQVAQKLASTLASTGSRASFLHPVEAMHGDLGMLFEGDLFIALSYSGETDELLAVIPAVKRLGVDVAAMTGNSQSSLALAADWLLPCTIDQEACPFNLAPTTTTTAMMALGDALAMVLMQQREFRIEDYGLLHPSGAIGRSVTMSVEDVMRSGKRLALVSADSTVDEAVLAMCESKGGTAVVVDGEGKLLGVFTTGDLKRGIHDDREFLQQPMKNVMVKNPAKINNSTKAVEILSILREKNINSLPVVDAKGAVVGLVDIQDLPKFKVL